MREPYDLCGQHLFDLADVSSTSVITYDVAKSLGVDIGGKPFGVEVRCGGNRSFVARLATEEEARAEYARLAAALAEFTGKPKKDTPDPK